MDFSGHTISELVKTDYRTADVFKKYGLSYCCGGNIPLEVACAAKGVDMDEISGELGRSTRTFILSNSLPFQEWRPDFMVDYISNVHHTYIYQTLPSLSAALESFSLGHMSKYPELKKLTELFSRLSALLMQHNRYEDEIIFPYIKQIETAYRKKEVYGNLLVRTLRKPLLNTEREHLEIQELMNGMKALTNQFTTPAKACINYGVIYKKLEELHQNLVQHKWLEQEVLFPKAIWIEQGLLQF